MTHSPQEDSKKKEIMVLSHDPWPGFKKAFYIIFALGCGYLTIILFSTLPKVLH